MLEVVVTTGIPRGEYDHPSAPIRRFSDMYNRALLETQLEGGDVKAVHQTVLRQSYS